MITDLKVIGKKINQEYSNVFSKEYARARWGIASGLPTIPMHLAVTRKRLLDWQESYDCSNGMCDESINPQSIPLPTRIPCCTDPSYPYLSAEVSGFMCWRSNPVGGFAGDPPLGATIIATMCPATISGNACCTPDTGVFINSPYSLRKITGFRTLIEVPGCVFFNPPSAPSTIQPISCGTIYSIMSYGSSASTGSSAETSCILNPPLYAYGPKQPKLNVSEMLINSFRR